MTPKEKAKELVEKYYHLFSVELENTISYYEAKHCAIIAVDEILECTGNGLGTTKFSKEYWQQVKQEIESL